MPDGSVAKAYNTTAPHSNNLSVWVGYTPLNPTLAETILAEIGWPA